MSEPSWRRAARHAAVTFGVIVAVGVSVAAVGHPRDAFALGEGVGRLATFGALLTLPLSRLAQRGRRRLAWAIGGALGLGVAALLLVAVLTVAPRRRAALAPADRAALIEEAAGAGRRLRHPTLGFSLDHPGPGFTSSPELARKVTPVDDPGWIAYAYVDAGAAAPVALVVDVLMDAGATRTAFEDGLAGLVRGVTRGAARAGGAAAVAAPPEVVWTADRRQARQALTLGEARVRIVAHALRRADGTPFVVYLMAIEPAGASLGAVLDSLRPG